MPHGAKLLLGFAILALSICQLMPAEPVGIIREFGIYKRAEKEQVIVTPETSSGLTRIPAGQLSLQTKTNRIPAKLGLAFGITYEVSVSNGASPETIEVLKVVSHPPMTKPDGQVARGFTIRETLPAKNGKAIAQTGYSFDHAYELVPGTWTIEVRHEGKTLVKQVFKVFTN